MTALGLAELADRTCLEPSGWSVVVVEETRLDETTEALREELSFLLEEDEGGGSVRVLSGHQAGSALIAQIALLNLEDVVLLSLTADVVESVARSFDYERGRLVGGPRGVILTSEAGVRALASEAPNFWSWIGPRVWGVDSRAGQLDRDARLASLREGSGMSDAEMLLRVEARTIKLDPVIAEWLVLLGKGDLLGD